MPLKSSPPAASEARPDLAAQSGAARSFEELFHQNWEHVFRFLQRLVGDPAEAEDLALETFLRLYQRPPAPAPGQNIAGWLHTVAANLGLTSLRRSQRRQNHELESGRFDLQEQPQASPAELLAAAEDRRHVRQVLAAMDERQARLLALRYSGLSYRDIAAQLGVAPTSIGPLLVRAEKEFEKRYQALDPEVKHATPG